MFRSLVTVLLALLVWWGTMLLMVTWAVDKLPIWAFLLVFCAFVISLNLLVERLLLRLLFTPRDADEF